MRLDIKKITELYASGKTSRGIASLLGCSKSGVILAVKKSGLKVREAKPRNNSGPANGNWKGGRCLTSDGYVMIWKPEGYKLEHRLVMNAIKGEIVHHGDHTKNNNDPQNLSKFASHGEHLKRHLLDAEQSLSVNPYRNQSQPGEKNPKAKLTNRAVLQIRSLKGKMTHRELGKQFGVSHSVINNIQNGKTWKHLQDPGDGGQDDRRL